MVTTDTRRNHIPVGFSSRKFYIHCLLTGLYRSNQLRKSQISIRSYYKVHMMVFYQIIFYPLGHTPQYTYNKVLLFLLHRMKELQTIQNLLFGIVTDRAGIHKHRISLFQCFGNRITRHLHHRGDYFTICHIHLAAISLDKQLLVVISSCGFKVRSRQFVHKFRI